MQQILNDTLATAPIGAIILISLAVILIHAFVDKSGALQRAVALFGIAASMALAVWNMPLRGTAFNHMLMTGGYASAVTLIILLAAGLAILISRDYLEKIKASYGEFIILVLLSVSGMIAFATGLDLIATFIGLEVLSVALYALAGMTRKRLEANEAALKYFLLGAFSTGFFLYGIALIYGTTGSTSLIITAERLAEFHTDPLFLAGCGLLLVGFAFKVGAAPFPMWAPDVYEGSSTVVTAFMATGAKASAFAALLLVFTLQLGSGNGRIALAIGIISAASMILGNMAALAQSNIKRMLAYSSIAHAGYMLVGVASGNPTGAAGALFYLLSYTFTTIGAFAIVAAVENEKQENVTIESFAGLGHSRPMLGGLMSLFLFSLIGLPPLSGFFGKYYVFYAAVEAGSIWLVIVGVVTSIISLYYYLRVIVVMYFRADETAPSPASGYGIAAALLISAAGVLIFGIFPSLAMNLLPSLL